MPDGARIALQPCNYMLQSQLNKTRHQGLAHKVNRACTSCCSMAKILIDALEAADTSS